MDENKRIPVNIICTIVKEFATRLSTNDGSRHNSSLVLETDLTKSSYEELGQLRLISRAWSEAALPYYFRTITLKGSRYAQKTLDHLKNDIFRARLSSHVKTLVIGNLWYVELSEDCPLDEDELHESYEFRYFALNVKAPTPISMNQLSALIEMIGTNLKTLDLTFITSLGVSNRFIKAIETMKDLKSLSISTEFLKLSEYGSYDTVSISDFFSAIPQLECLSFQYKSIESLNLKPGCLSNLRCFSFYQYCNLEALIDIVQTSKNTLKSIEVILSDLHPDDCEGLVQVFQPVKDTLEGIFTPTLCEHLASDITSLNFPKLRVLGDWFGSEHRVIDHHCFQVPMLKNVRTIVTDLEGTAGGNLNWGSRVADFNLNFFKQVPSFRNFIFTKGQHDPYRLIEPELERYYTSRGIQCHVVKKSTCIEIMELDNKLHGPMK